MKITDPIALFILGFTTDDLPKKFEKDQWWRADLFVPGNTKPDIVKIFWDEGQREWHCVVRLKSNAKIGGVVEIWFNKDKLEIREAFLSDTNDAGPK